MLDLALARSYVPLCLCCAKVYGLCILIVALRSCELPYVNIFAVAASLLFVDRVSNEPYVFDTNSLTCFVFATRVLDAARTVPPGEVPEGKPAIRLALDIVWSVVAFGALVRAPERFAFFRYVPFRPTWLSAGMFALQSFLSHEPEVDGWVFLRVFNFLGLCMVWMYLVNVRQLSARTVYDGTECMVLFGHVLLMSLPVMAGATLFSCAAIPHLWQHPSERGGTDSEREDTKLCSSDTSDHPSGEPYAEEEVDVEAGGDDMAKLEALFREAKQRALEEHGGGARMRNVY